jgi:hypothetical protein
VTINIPNDGVIVDSAKALAAVPDAVGKTITSFSNISENLSCNSVEISSLHMECYHHHSLLRLHPELQDTHQQRYLKQILPALFLF